MGAYIAKRDEVGERAQGALFVRRVQDQDAVESADSPVLRFDFDAGFSSRCGKFGGPHSGLFDSFGTLFSEVQETYVFRHRIIRFRE